MLFLPNFSRLIANSSAHSPTSARETELQHSRAAQLALQERCIDLESFEASGAGAQLRAMETQLAHANLARAMAEEAKDQLEMQLEHLQKSAARASGSASNKDGALRSAGGIQFAAPSSFAPSTPARGSGKENSASGEHANSGSIHISSQQSPMTAAKRFMGATNASAGRAAAAVTGGNASRHVM